MNRALSKTAWARAKEVGFRPILLCIPVGLSMGGAVCEWLSAVLLLPAVEGGIRYDVGTAAKSPVFRLLLAPLGALALPDRALFTLLLAVIAGASLLKTALFHAASVRFIAIAHGLSERLRTRIFRACLAADKVFFDSANSAQIQNAAIGQVNAIFYNALLLQDSAAHLFMLLAYGSVMAWISWPLTLVAAISLPFLHVVGGRLTASIGQASMANAEAQSCMSKRIADACRNFTLVHAEGARDIETRRFAEAASRATDLQTAMDVRTSLVPKLQESVFILMLVGLLFALSDGAAPHRPDLVPALFVFVYVARRASLSAMAVLRARTTLSASAGAVSDILALISQAESRAMPEGDSEFHGIQESLECRNLSLEFPTGVRALEDVSFSLRRGETLALVGPSGSGKSSLVHVLLRLYAPTRGGIFADGVDLRLFSSQSLAAKFAFIPQTPQLIDDTLRNNILYPCAAGIDESRLAGALRKAALDDFVASLPDGLDTRIGEGGIRLSGGERQRVALARAVYKNADLLVLDEATSALDATTEDLVRSAVFGAAGLGMTTIAIAHRLSTIRHAETIVVLNAGKVAQAGNFESLKSRSGIFRDMLDRQEFK